MTMTIVRSLCEWLFLLICSYDEVTSLVLLMGRNHMGCFLSIERKYVYIIGIIAFVATSCDKFSVSLAAILLHLTMFTYDFLVCNMRINL